MGVARLLAQRYPSLDRAGAELEQQVSSPSFDDEHTTSPLSMLCSEILWCQTLLWDKQGGRLPQQGGRQLCNQTRS